MRQLGVAVTSISLCIFGISAQQQLCQSMSSLDVYRWQSTCALILWYALSSLNIPFCVNCCQSCLILTWFSFQLLSFVHYHRAIPLRGVRIGEAANPGPKRRVLKDKSIAIAIVNPTSIANKQSQFEFLIEKYNIVCLRYA